MTRASLDKKPGEVARMFDGVARRYDLTNTVLSFGLDRHWRRRTRQCLELRAGQQVLDLAAGTGVSTVELARGGADAVACDFSLGMLRAGRARRRGVPFVAGDAMALPFADASFDAAVISFGLRNVADVPRALPWIARRVSSNADAYVYLAESIRAWPAQADLARTIASAGWRAVRYRNPTGGLVALHRAER